MATTTGDTVNGSFGLLDFTALPYNVTTTTNFNATSGVLTVTTGSNYESLTLTNPGAASFKVSSDGSSGTDVAGAGGGTVGIASQPAGPVITPKPTDTVVQISFDNDQLSSTSRATGILSGSTAFDLTNGTSQGSYTFVSNGQTETFSGLDFIANEPPSGMTFVSGSDSDGDTLTFSFLGQQPSSLSNFGIFSGSTSAGTSTVFGGPAPITATLLCFVTGTLIRTTDGDRAVERLRVGDLVVTASGKTRPVRWIGHRAVDCPAQAIPSEFWPVRIRAGAFGVGGCGAVVPERDLFLSPGHPVLVGYGDDEVLVPVMCLINGTSVARVPRARVTYWHVELDVHDILLAEGLPAESFLDLGNRSWFGEAAADGLANPDHVAPGIAGRCRPVAIDGPAVEAERRRLEASFAMDLALAARWPTHEGVLAGF